MKYFKFAVILFVFTSISFFAKAQDFIVKGVVIEKGSNIRIALSEITNPVSYTHLTLPTIYSV